MLRMYRGGGRNSDEKIGLYARFVFAARFIGGGDRDTAIVFGLLAWLFDEIGANIVGAEGGSQCDQVRFVASG
jgi:hypothetical protein